jgi:hypothetical protein
MGKGEADRNVPTNVQLEEKEAANTPKKERRPEQLQASGPPFQKAEIILTRISQWAERRNRNARMQPPYGLKTH